VTLSGTLNYFYGYFDNGGNGYANTTAGSTLQNQTGKVRTDAMGNSESEWALSGQENLGGGMSAFFLCSTSMDIVGVGSTTMCGRNSNIGLKGNFGSVQWGNDYTPMKVFHSGYLPFPLANPMGQQILVAGVTASGVGNGQVGAGFSRRQTNLIRYSMPTMNGFDAMVAYSAANEATGNTTGSTIQKPRLWSAMLQYTNGPLQLGGAYERHQDYNPGTGTASTTQATAYNGGRDNAYNLGVAYTFMGSLKVSALYVNTKYETGAGTDVSQTNFGLFGDWAISGPHRVRLGYSIMGATKGTFVGGLQGSTVVANGGAGQTGAQKLSFEYAYAMSKRTEVSLGYGRINNDRNSNVAVGTGSALANYGESQTYTGLRIKHTF
jgi:predicted porin